MNIVKEKVAELNANLNENQVDVEFINISGEMIYKETLSPDQGSYRLYLGSCKPGAGTYILKISGIWETNNEIGITYKLLQTNDVVSPGRLLKS